MKSDKTCSTPEYAIWTYGALLLSAVLPALLAVKNIRISPDSMIYALISKEILSGSGISWPILYELTDNFSFTDGSTPYLGQPPLLPILFALLGGVSPQNYLAAQVINVISHASVSVFTFLLMNKLYRNNNSALLTAMLVSFSYPMLWNTHVMLSESLFIAFTVSALYFLTSTRRSENYRSVVSLFVSSIFACAAILTRFSGISLIPVLIYETAILVKQKSESSRVRSACLASLLPVITTAALFTRNYMISGTIMGWNPPPPERSYLDALSGTVKMIYLQFHLNQFHITVILVFIILFALYGIINSDVRRHISKHLNSGADLISVFIICYTLLVSQAMATSQTVFELRYMSPLVPVLFILCSLFIITVADMMRHKGFPKSAVCITVFFFGVIAFGNFYKTSLNWRSLLTQQEGHYRILNSPMYNWIKETYDEDTVITTNRPFHVSFFGGYSTIRLPHRRFERHARIPDNMELYLPERMSHFGSTVLALFEEIDEQYEGRYVAGLFHRRTGDDNFVLVREFSDGVTYKLQEK